MVAPSRIDSAGDLHVLDSVMADVKVSADDRQGDTGVTPV